MKRKHKIINHQDTPWKSLLEVYFRECIGFFLPDFACQIDWQIPPIFLDKELAQLTKSGETGQRIVDKLAQITLLSGVSAQILLHAEVQGHAENGFSERLFIYHARIFDKYRKPVITVAILTDSDPQWHPREYHSEVYGCEISLRFPVFKVLDYRGKEAELEINPNPFALVVLSQLAALQVYKRKSISRLQEKVRLMQFLFQKIKQRNLERKFAEELLKFIDWIIGLPDELELQYNEEAHKVEQEMAMSYVTTFERFAMQKGMQAGESLVLTLFLEQKFGTIPEKYRQKIAQADSDTLMVWAQYVLKAATIQDVFQGNKTPEFEQKWKNHCI